jgi:hypothetical protein
MPARIFAITAARDTVIVDSQGRAEVSFTASNTAPKPITGRAKLMPVGSTKEEWLTLDGDQERKFAKGEAHQFTARIAVPPGTPAGKYAFRLNIISVENPDEDFTEGPSVSFEVKELAPAKPSPRKFPWWIVALAAVVILGAGLITWLLIPQKNTVPEVVGMPYQDAIKSLGPAKLGYIVSDQRVITGKVPIGTIANQSPAAGQQVPPGTKVTLTVEAQSVQVPNLRGKWVKDAFDELRSLNLVPLYREGEVAGNWAALLPVVWQSPEPGARVAPGSSVTINAR